MFVISIYMGGFVNGILTSNSETYSQCQIGDRLRKANSHEVTSTLPIGVLNEASSRNSMTQELEWQYLFTNSSRHLFLYVNPYTERQFVLLVDDAFMVKDCLTCETILGVEYPLEGIGTHLVKLLTKDHAVVIYGEKIVLESKREMFGNLKRKLGQNQIGENKWDAAH